MTLLIPIAFLLAGAFAVMTILARNLASLGRESDAMWEQLQATRRSRNDVMARIADAARTNGVDDPFALQAVERAFADAQAAEDPTRAAEADDALYVAHRNLLDLIEGRAPALLERTPFSLLLEELGELEDRMTTCKGLYNNRVTMYGNAGRTFPTLLIAKQRGFAPRECYLPREASDPLAVAAASGSTALAEASPRIMNAYSYGPSGYPTRCSKKRRSIEPGGSARNRPTRPFPTAQKSRLPSGQAAASEQCERRRYARRTR